MAFATMHFGVGMACGGTLATIGCMITGKGWKYIPWAMTIGGIWACVPDMPRLWREDFPGLPFAAVLGDKANERALLSNWFCFHRSLDQQPKEFALHGLFLIIAQYNAAYALVSFLAWREKQRFADRTSKAYNGLRLRFERFMREHRAKPGMEMTPEDLGHSGRSSHLSRREAG